MLTGTAKEWLWSTHRLRAIIVRNPYQSLLRMLFGWLFSLDDSSLCMLLFGCSSPLITWPNRDRSMLIESINGVQHFNEVTLLLEISAITQTEILKRVHSRFKLWIQSTTFVKEIHCKSPVERMVWNHSLISKRIRIRRLRMDSEFWNAIV